MTAGDPDDDAPVDDDALDDDASDEAVDDALEGDDPASDPTAADLEALPPCPLCGDDVGGCEHVFAVVRADDELLGAVAEWAELDDMASDLQRLTLDGDAALEFLARRPDAWWIVPRGQGGGLSRRMAGADAIAARFRLIAAPLDDDAGVAYFVDDPTQVRERLTTALQRIRRELVQLAKSLGHDLRG
ncbi:MAG TPA: hypothetical protein VEI02_07090 [Planctomycetota bacterium]|nr:hypothetical protein [Planctomycetota bacterium]